MMKEKKLITKTTAASLLGIAVRKLHRTGLKPVKEIPNPHYRNAAPSQLYDEAAVLRLKGSEVVEALKPRPAAPRDYTPLFVKRYGRPERAIPDAAEALFNLNRYAKYPKCSDDQRQEIYRLKSDFVQLLYQRGYCQHHYLHTKDFAEVPCRSCGGTGYNSQGDCGQCCGTGIFLEANKMEWVVFSFDVEGKAYIWHVPIEQVRFTVNAVDGGELNPTEKGKAIFINPRKFKYFKELINWIITQTLEKNEKR